MRMLVMISLFAASTLAADFGGTWLGELPAQSNRNRLRMSQQVAFQLVQNGSTLSGKLYGEYESSPIIEGKVTGDTGEKSTVTPAGAGPVQARLRSEVPSEGPPSVVRVTE